MVLRPGDIICAKCQERIPHYSLFCPHCGQPPIDEEERRKLEKQLCDKGKQHRLIGGFRLGDKYCCICGEKFKRPATSRPA